MEGLTSKLKNYTNKHGRAIEQFVDTKLDEFQAEREEAERQRLEEGKRQCKKQGITVTGGEVEELGSTSR